MDAYIPTDIPNDFMVSCECVTIYRRYMNLYDIWIYNIILLDSIGLLFILLWVVDSEYNEAS